MAALVYILFAMTSAACLVPAAHVSFGELEFRTLEYEFEVLLKMYLREWRFLTEASAVMDIGEVLPKRMFFQDFTVRSCEVSGTCGGENRSTFPETVNVGDTESTIRSGTRNASVNDIKPVDPNDTTNPSDPTTLRAIKLKPMLYDDKPGYGEDMSAIEPSHDRSHTSGDLDRTTNKDKSEEQELLRGPREAAGMPVMYMPGGGGGRKTRKCAQVSGLLAGFNTFNYLTFVTGVITLILNATNNLNNNNNNNNLNNNNDLSNNNVNANTNTQNANQVVLFPPGRKRRSIADWLLQIATSRAVNFPDAGSKTGEGNHVAGRGRSDMMSGTSPRNQMSVDLAKTVSEAPWCAASDAVVPILQVLDAWLEASTGVGGECGWAEYCHLLYHLTVKGAIPAVLAAPLRSLSNMVSPEWVGSTVCLLHIARCSL